MAFSDGAIVAILGLFLVEEFLAAKHEVGFLLGEEKIDGVIHLIDADFAVAVLVSSGVHLLEWGQLKAISNGVIVAVSCLILAHGVVTVDVELRLEDIVNHLNV